MGKKSTISLNQWIKRKCRNHLVLRTVLKSNTYNKQEFEEWLYEVTNNR